MSTYKHWKHRRWKVTKAVYLLTSRLDRTSMSRYDRVLFHRIMSTSTPICSCSPSTHQSHLSIRKFSWPASTSRTTSQSDYVCMNHTVCKKRSRTGLFSSYFTQCVNLTPAATATSSQRTSSSHPWTTCSCVILCRVNLPASQTRTRSITSGSAIWIIIKDAIRHQSDGINRKNRN